MRKIHFIALVGLMALYSCRKPEPSELFLKQEQYHFYDSPDEDWVGKYSYSNDGQLTMYEEFQNDDARVRINFYYSNNVMDSSEYYTKIAGIFTVSMTNYYAFDSNNNLKSLINKGSGFNNTVIYNYKNERIDSVDWVYRDDDITLQGYFKYLTDNPGNVVWQHSAIEYQHDTIIYQYDDKINPFHKIFKPIAFSWYGVEYFSPDNCTKNNYFSYRYEYNSRGYPVKKYTTEIQTSILRSVAEFQYAER